MFFSTRSQNKLLHNLSRSFPTYIPSRGYLRLNTFIRVLVLQIVAKILDYHLDIVNNKIVNKKWIIIDYNGL